MSHPLPTLQNDFATVQGMILEHWNIHGQTVLYEVFSRASTQLTDDLHGEALEAEKVFKPPVQLRTAIEANPPQQQLTKWGIDEPRDIVLHPAVVSLVAAGLARWSQEDDPTSRPIFGIDVGDRFIWDDTRYEVNEVVRSQYWGNTNRPTYLRITAVRWRSSTADFNCEDVGNPGPFSGGTGSILGDDPPKC